MDNNVNKNTNAEIEQLILKQKKMRKSILIFCVAVVLVAAVVIGVLLIVGNLSEKKDDSKNKNDGPTSYIFYKQDYNEDIFENRDYMQKNRNIMYYNPETGVTQAASLEENDKYVKLLSELTEAIINGDAKTYNSFFSEKYYKTHEPRERFTMQMLYNITIAKHVTLDGVTYSLEYMIMKNNGSYRSDLPSDASKTQYFIISEYDGKLLIDDIRTK